MGQEHDVARVAAALNTPGLRYRSFGNEPVRVRPVAEPEPQPSPPPAADEEGEALLRALETGGAFGAMPPLPEALPAPAAPAPPVQAPAPPAAAAAPPPAPPPAPAPAPLAAPLPPLDWAAAAPAAPAPSAGLLREGEMALARPVAPVPAAPAAMPAPAPAMPEAGFALLDAIGAAPPPLPAPVRPPSATTLSLLRNGAGTGTLAGAPPEILPASRVTVPLAEVMRLISTGGQPPASPFDAVRASLHPAPASR